MTTPVEYVRNYQAQGICVDVPAIMMKYKVSPDEALKILLEAKQLVTVPEPAPVMQEFTPAPVVEENPELDWSELDKDHVPVQAVVRPDFLSTASKIIGWGGHVMYCAEGKKFGMPSAWQDMATRDLAQVAEWAKEDLHQNCIAVGKPDGMVWFDDDSDFIARYEAQYGTIHAPRVKSVSGGTHLGFRQTDLSRQVGNISKSDGNGGEAWSLRSINKYVVAFGSTAHPNNDENIPLAPYVLTEDCSAPEISETFIQALQSDRQNQPIAVAPAKTSTDFLGDTPPWVKTLKAMDGDFDAVLAAMPEVSEGGRNTTLARVIGKLHQIDWTDDNALAAAQQINETKFLPPLDEKELKTVVASVCRYPVIPVGPSTVILGGKTHEQLQAERVVPAQPIVTELTLEEAQKKVDEANEKLLADLSPDQRKAFDSLRLMNQTLTLDAAKAEVLRISGLGQPNEKASNWREEFRNVSQLEEGPIEMIINGVLQEGVCFIGASAGDGKTLVALAMAKAIALGRPLFGIQEFLVKTPRNVIYLIPESSDKPFRVRCENFRLPKDDRFLTRTISSGAPLSLDHPALLEGIRQNRAVVFLDTASRFITSEDENSSAENRMLVDDIITLRAAGSPCVVVLHHAKKSAKEKREPMTLENMLRGTGDYGAMCDQVYGIRADDRLRDNGAGPLEIDIENLKDREQLGGLTKLRLAASYKKEGLIFPVSYISETGDFRAVDHKQTMDRLEDTLVRIVQAEPMIPISDIAGQTGLSTYKVKDILEGVGWHNVKGGSEGRSPWHQDKGQPCPYKTGKQAIDLNTVPKASGSESSHGGPRVGAGRPKIKVSSSTDKRSAPL